MNVIGGGYYMQKNNLIVKEPEELILMRGNFSESALKLGAYLIAILEKGQTIYEINIKEYLTNFDKKLAIIIIYIMLQKN